MGKIATITEEMVGLSYHWGYIMYCSFCRTHKERTGMNTWVCECSFCAGCDARTHEDFLDNDNLCEKCVKKAYNEKHECTACGDLYAGNLIDCGINAAKIQMMQCPSCTAYDLFHEISLMEKALPEDSEGHRLFALELMGRLKEELTREGDDENTDTD